MIEIENVKWTKIPKLVLSCLLFIALWSFSAEAATPAGVTITVEGISLTMAVPPTIIADRTMVSVRAVGEAVGGTVTWDPVKRQVLITRRSDTIILTLGNKEALVNGKAMVMDVPAQLVRDSTMVPLRFIAEALGGQVEWDGATRRANILRKPTKILGMTYSRDMGKATLVVALSEPPATIKPQTVGNTLSLDLWPAVIQVESLPGAQDMLMKGLSLRSEGRSVKLQAELWQVPTYQYSLSADGTRLVVEINYTLTGIQFQQDGRIPTVNVIANGKVDYTTLQLTNPARLAVDITGAGLAPGVPSNVEVGQPFLARIRSSQSGTNPNRVRVVMDTTNVLPYDVISTELGLQIRFVPQIQAVKTEKLLGKTRLTFTGNLPMDAKVSAVPGQKQLLIEIPQGRSALKESALPIADGAIGTITVAGGATKDSTRITVNLPYYLGHTVVSRTGETDIVIDLVTSSVYGKRIWIDAGHGGTDPGALGRTYKSREKDLTLSVALELQRQLQAAGATVYMTRTTDVTVSLEDRSKRANGTKPTIDLFISLHFNSATSTTVRGIETYYWTTNPRSQVMAEKIHAAVIKSVGFPDRRVRQEDFYVIKNTLAPSVLVEMGYLSNSEEEKAILEPANPLKTYPGKVAEAIKNGIFDYFRQEK